MGKKRIATGKFDLPLGDYLDGIVDRLRELVPQAVKVSDVDAIHQVRVATRRLRAAVDLIEPITSEADRIALLKTLRKLRRRLGPLRDLDVMLGHLRDLRRNRSHVPAIEWIETRFQVDRAAAADAARDEIAPSKVLSRLGAFWGLRQQMTDARAQIDLLIETSLQQKGDDFALRADKLVAADQQCDPHAVRIAGKLLRYTLEMADAAKHPLPSKLLKTFKKMQDCLGLWHDFVVLTEQALNRSADEMLAHHDAAMQKRILAFAQLTLGKSELHLKRFSAIWSEQGRQIREGIGAIFHPQPSETVIEPKTDRDPSDSAGPSIPDILSQADPAVA